MMKTTTEPTTEHGAAEVAARIRGGSDFLITSHRNPDGDALGSALALRFMIEALGKNARVIVRDRWATPLRHLPGTDEVTITDSLPPDYPEAWSALFTMECPEKERCGYDILPGPVVNIDHHLGNTMYGEVNWLDLEAPSVGEMLLALADELEVELDERMATAIYVSLASDTGFFRYTNTTLRAFEAAQRLVRAGANPGEISLWLNESQDPAALKLLGLCLSTLEMHAQGRISMMKLTNSMLADAGADPEHADGISSYGRVIEGVEVAAFLKETDEGTRVSLRAKPGVDVQQVAASFGGGGHKAAAGCLIEKPLDEARAILLEKLVEAVNA
jgi:bifunctional oligoribonuclease and PAP phosphatase NrnA